MSKKSRNRKVHRRFIRMIRRDSPPVPTVHQILRQRQIWNRSLASTARHIRVVQRDGDEGARCFDCENIPLHPWELTLSEDESEVTW